MKIKFYTKNKKKKTQVIKVDNNEDLKTAILIAKCELTKQNILKDLDFSDSVLVGEIKDKQYSMKKLYEYLMDKLNSHNKKYIDSKKGNNGKPEKSKKKKKEKKSSGKKDKKKDKSKKKNKKSKNDSFTKGNPIKLFQENTSTNDGLVHITRIKK